MKNPVTSSEIEPATFQLVLQCHKELRYGVIPYVVYIIGINGELWRPLSGCLCQTID
jgi:hypothetical protein